MKIVIKEPVISEKSMKLAGQGLFSFIVGRDARKPEIAKAIEEKFDVNVVAVKTANFKDETRLQRGRRGYYTVAGFKKALVQLKEGQKIGLFELDNKGEEKEEVKEKKNLLKGTKVKVEKVGKETKKEEKAEEK